jgi:dTDP-4-dehydrorhamnose 3,5-epimerase
MDGVSILRGDRMIDGASFVPRRRIPDERGTIMHMLRRDEPHFAGFGEVYFTTVHSGAVKGWHRHRGMTVSYACPYGRVKLVLYDDREGSPTRGTLVEAFLGPENHALAVIPPEVWNGLKGLNTPFALVANCASEPHDPSRTERLDPHGDEIPYDWSRRDR